MSRQSWLSGAVGLALVLVGWASPASAQSAQEQTFGNIVDRLVRIEEDFGQWQRAIAEGGTIVVTDSEAMAAMNTRVADLSQDLADLAAQARSQDINLDEFAGRVGQFGASHRGVRDAARQSGGSGRCAVDGVGGGRGAAKA